MNDVAKLYQVYINREIQVAKNEILNTTRINQKILSFLHDLSEVALESRCYLFWEKEEPVNHQQLLENYLEGLTMLMSIGYELRIDSIKNHTEIPENQDLYSLFFNSPIKPRQTSESIERTSSFENFAAPAAIIAAIPCEKSHMSR